MRKNDAKLWMRGAASSHVDHRTNTVNLTSLAEACCQAFGVDDVGGPLDDHYHWVWEVAADVAAWWEAPVDF